jgi:predicted RNase H-like nuclease (RuvC/YqgF family)
MQLQAVNAVNSLKSLIEKLHATANEAIGNFTELQRDLQELEELRKNKSDFEKSGKILLNNDCDIEELKGELAKLKKSQDSEKEANASLKTQLDVLGQSEISVCSIVCVLALYRMCVCVCVCACACE